MSEDSMDILRKARDEHSAATLSWPRVCNIVADVDAKDAEIARLQKKELGWLLREQEWGMEWTAKMNELAEALRAIQTLRAEVERLKAHDEIGNGLIDAATAEANKMLIDINADLEAKLKRRTEALAKAELWITEKYEGHGIDADKDAFVCELRAALQDGEGEKEKP